MARICTSPYPIEKVGDSPYLVNMGILFQNGDGFGQYPRGWVYLPSLDDSYQQRGREHVASDGESRPLGGLRWDFA